MAFISVICINLSVLSQRSNLTDQARKRDDIRCMENDYRDKENIFAVCKFSMTAMLISISLMSSPDIYTMDMSVKPISEKLRIQTDETRWISLGADFRGTGLWVENQESGNLNGDLVVDNARLYLNGQFHSYLRFEINSECFYCSNPDMRTYNILDAIMKFEFNRYLNL